MNIKHLYLLTLNRGGLSYSVQENRFISKGYAVARYSERSVILDLDEFNTIKLDEFINDNLEALSNEKGLILGTWINPENNKVYLDLSEVYEKKDDALNQARALNEIAVYNLRKNENIYL